MPMVGGGAPGWCGSWGGEASGCHLSLQACSQPERHTQRQAGADTQRGTRCSHGPAASLFLLVQSSPVLLGASKLGHPTWQPPDEGEHGALQVPPEDGQPLLQPCWAHFTLALGAVHHQRGLVLVHRNGHNVLLAVTDLDLHQDQGDALNGQDDQLRGEARLSRGRAGGVAAKCPRALLSRQNTPLTTQGRGAVMTDGPPLPPSPCPGRWSQLGGPRGRLSQVPGRGKAALGRAQIRAHQLADPLRGELGGPRGRADLVNTPLLGQR